MTRNNREALCCLPVVKLLVVLTLVLLGATSCRDGEKATDGVARPTGYWGRPVPLQAEIPESWSPLERSLLPKDCGVCHPSQLSDWSTALHSKAMSPGLKGQLAFKKSPSFTRSCYKCHAPLIEQHKKIKKGKGWVDNPNYNAGLHDAGVTCAVCHVRDSKIHGPPPKDGLAREMSNAPHGGFTVDKRFQSAEFCAACHQFPSNWPKLNGKLLENTYEEWKLSPAAKEGKTCQTCHMPDRRHTFRGIHDPDMTRSAFDFKSEIAISREGKLIASATLTNVGAGHMAPTYVTPRIEITFQQIDANGKAIGDASEPTVIQRYVILGDGNNREIFDTRLAPGKSITASWSVDRSPAATSMRVVVRCIPDHFYEWLYRGLLKRYKDGSKPHKMIGEALREAEGRRFDVFSTEMALAE